MMKKLINKIPDKEKLGKDIFWNVISLGILGVSGMLLTTLVGAIYDAATLGVFNQVYAIFILFSQIAVAGVHASVLKYVSQHHEDSAKCNILISAGLATTLILGILSAILAYLLSDIFGLFLNSDDVAKGIMYIAPGLLFFALNKTLLAILNGFRRMKAFAFFQALRYILILASFFVIVFTSIPKEALPAVFSAAEIILFLLLMIFSLRLFTPVSPLQWGHWVSEHLSFGFRSMGGGILVEMNSRVDVLMLGYFCTDTIVGIYSFAAVFVEGLYQLLIVLRNNLNPILTRFVTSGKYEELKAMVRHWLLIVYPSTLAIGLAAIFLYPLGINLLHWLGFMKNSDIFMSGWPIFSILIAGVILSSGYVPFGTILSQAGYPGLNSIYILCVVACNIALNALLIPLYDITGAAIATSISYVLSVFLLQIFVRKSLKITI